MWATSLALPAFLSARWLAPERREAARRLVLWAQKWLLQGLAFFLLPLYHRSAVYTPGQTAFMALLSAAALAATIDVVYDDVVAPRRPLHGALVGDVHLHEQAAPVALPGRDLLCDGLTSGYVDVRDDDVRIGIRTSALTLGQRDVAAVMAFYAVHLVSWAAIGRTLGLGGWFLAGVAAAAAQALWHWTLIRTRERAGCFRAFRLNHWVGFALFAGTALDLALR